jgi:tetratricopeptide (TPR) repeat protein
MPVEPTNKFWKSQAAGAELDFARALLSQGRVDEAKQQTQSGCALVEEIRGRNPATPKLTSCLKMRSRLALQSGDYSQALAFAGRALMSARSDPNEDPVLTKFSIATTYRLIGDVRQRSGDTSGANDAWSKALASIPNGVAERPPEIDEHALILERLGRAPEARALVSRLKAMGYRRQS